MAFVLLKCIAKSVIKNGDACDQALWRWGAGVPLSLEYRGAPQRPQQGLVWACSLLTSRGNFRESPVCVIATPLIPCFQLLGEQGNGVPRRRTDIPQDPNHEASDGAIFSGLDERIHCLFSDTGENRAGPPGENLVPASERISCPNVSFRTWPFHLCNRSLINSERSSQSCISFWTCSPDQVNENWDCIHRVRTDLGCRHEQQVAWRTPIVAPTRNQELLEFCESIPLQIAKCVANPQTHVSRITAH